MITKRRLWVIISLILFVFFLYRFDSLLQLFQTLLSIISPFIIGFFMALLINLPMKFFEKRWAFMDRTRFLSKARRPLSLTISVLMVTTVITLLLIVIIPEVIAAVERLILRIPDLLKQLEVWLSERNANIRTALGLAEANETDVRGLFQQAYQFLIGGLSYSSGVVVSAAQSIFSLVISLVFAIYLLFSKERLQRQLSRLVRAVLPKKASAFVLRVIRMLVDDYSSFLGGQILQAFITSILTILVLMIFSFPYAVLIGLITFVAALIPVFGPYIAGFLGMLLVLTAAPSQTLWFVLAFFIVQQLVGSVIYPRIMSNAIDIPTLWVLVAVTVGGGIMGIAGMFLFIPIVSVLFHLMEEFVSRREKSRVTTESQLHDPL